MSETNRVSVKLCRLMLLLLLANIAFSVQAQNPAEWKRYELGKGNFSVLLPSEPREEIKSAPPSIGIAVDSLIYTSKGSEGTFVAQYNVLGEAAASWNESTREAFQNGVWVGVAEGIDKELEIAKLEYRTKVVEKRAIKFGGYPGREVVFTLGPFQGRMWTTIIGRQAFVGIVVVTPNTLSQQQKFLDSFTIKLQPVNAADPTPN